MLKTQAYRCENSQQNVQKKYLCELSIIRKWKSKTQVASCELLVQIYELRVQIHELRVRSHKLRVRIHHLRFQIHQSQVQIDELRVQIHMLGDLKHDFQD